MWRDIAARTNASKGGTSRASSHRAAPERSAGVGWNAFQHRSKAPLNGEGSHRNHSHHLDYIGLLYFDASAITSLSRYGGAAQGALADETNSEAIMKRTLLLVGIASFLLGAGCASRSPNDGATEIYNSRADGEEQLAATLAEARRMNKRVLLNLGANWCGDSQAMFRLFNTNTEIARTIEGNYIFEMIDVNQRGLGARNRALVERLGEPLNRGIPVLLILDARGKVLNGDPAERLADSDHMHPGVVLAYLRKWARTPPAE